MDKRSNGGATWRCIDAMLVSLICVTQGASAQIAVTAPAPAAASAQQPLRAVIESGAPTPLDALTSHGRREAIEQMRWRDNELVGFGTAALVRELDRAQLAAVLRFLDTSAYLPMLDKSLVGPPLRLPPPSAELERAMATLRQFADEDGQRRALQAANATVTGASAVLRRYQELFGARMDNAALSMQSDGDLLVLFDAAGLALQANPASSAMDDLLRVHAQLRARGIATGRTLDHGVMHALLASRRFEQARTFAADRPHLADMPVPQVVDALGAGFHGRSTFTYDSARNTLTRHALPVPNGVELVMVVGAGCHNSTNALASLHDDATLQARLRDVNVVLVTAPNAAIETGLLTQWNAANPALPIRVPYSAQEWRAVEVTGIPSFHLFRNGVLVAMRTGWPADGKAILSDLIDEAAR